MPCDSGADYVRGANPIWYLVDLVGDGFDDTFYMWVLQNEIPYIPAPVYHTPTGTPWTDPIQFLANGTLPVDVFFDPDIVYRLEFRKNDGTAPPSQQDALIYLVENYSPNGQNANPIDLTATTTANQVSNPQFAEISFESPYSLTATNPNSIEIAPGWFLDVSGTGTVTVEQVPLNNALSNPTNAPYALHLTLAGWTGFSVLRQKFSQNGMLWANKYVSLSFTGRVAATPQTLTSRLVASDGQPLAILANSLLTTDFVEYTGVAQLPATLNADLPPDAYIEYEMLLPNGEYYLTSFQLIAGNTPQTVAYEQDSVDRQIDHLFHYYKPQLEYKPIPSYLVGWDFPLNPAQLFGDTVASSGIGANKSKYAWDQTIVFQSVDNCVAVSRATSGGITLTADATGQVAMIQYLTQDQAREILSGNCSVAIKGFCSVGTQTATVSLWATDDANLPNVDTGTNDSIVATLGANGDVATQNGNWTQLSPPNPGNVTFTLTTTPSEFMFSGWTDNPANPLAETATYFAIVIGTNSITNTRSVTFDWVSLNAGEIATRPAPKTADETLRACEQFYEKSYASSVVAATVTDNNSIIKNQNAYLTGVTYHMVASGFSIEFRSLKRVAPVISLYSPATGTVGTVLGGVFGLGSGALTTGAVATTIWTPTISTKSAYYALTTYNEGIVDGSGAGGGWAAGYIRLHYVADARLGIVN